MDNENFLGYNGFIWFVGVVEDRLDPLETGRVKVRILGHHDKSKTILPTADLPWAQCLLPTTSAGISGIGTSPSKCVEGSWVLGYFKDGSRKQDPLILGTLPGYSSELSTGQGFQDPNQLYPTAANESDVSRLARAGTEHTSLTSRKAARKTSITTADFDPIESATGDAGDMWSQPAISAAPQYPFNTVTETESGHIIELDDTPAKERIHVRHRIGTAIEMLEDGSRVDIIEKDHYTLTANDNKVYIQGDSDVTIDGRHKIYVNKNGGSNDYTIQVGAGANVNIQVDSGDCNIHTRTGKMNLIAGDDFNLKVGGNMKVEVDGYKTETVNGFSTFTTIGPVIMTGFTIDFNPF
jgi:hypothetical protein